MVIQTVEQASLRFSPIIHVLLVQDFGPISLFMNKYVDFLRNYVDDPNESERIEQDMVILYLSMYQYLSEDEDRSVALLHHLQEDTIEFHNGELPIGKIEVQFETEPEPMGLSD
tara:strand:- start:962 stop:1303 length:342 start_codon:yes stop_codon:yes gene_type:complete